MPWFKMVLRIVYRLKKKKMMIKVESMNETKANLIVLCVDCVKREELVKEAIKQSQCRNCEKPGVRVSAFTDARRT